MKLQIFRKFLWLCLLLVSVAGYAQEAPETWMPDLALRGAVRETLELPADVPLTKNHMQELDIFRAIERGISDLTGMEFAINLREADFSGNLITDLRPLEDLIHLETLVLYVNRISDISPLAGLINLLTLRLSGNPISDLSPLAGLPKFKELEARRIWTTDFSSLAGLGLEIHHDEICEITPFPPPVTERIQNRTFPSIALPRRTYWDDPNIYYDVAAKHDIHYFSTKFGLHWDLTPIASTEGLSTQLAGQVMGQVLNEYKKYALRNPNMLFFPDIRLHNRHGLDELPENSDFWLRDAEGQILKNDVPWDEYTIDILNPEVQQLLIDRIVGVADCGYFSGVYFDAFAPYHQYVYDKHFNIGDEAVIQAYINILKGIRARVRDDFLILVNRNRNISPRYAEWINGSRMEIGVDYPGGYTYESLIGIENALSWNEKHLREPRINILEADGVVNQPPDGPNNLRWMRVFTTLSLTHSDGYSIFRGPIQNGDEYKEVPGVYQQYGDHTWYDFWDADLGRPVGEKVQTYDNRDGIFIREFDNGWAVYNRSGREQIITLPRSEGVASGVVSTEHRLADLDGEIYLKSESGLEVPPTPDVNGDGMVNVLDLVAVANAFGEDTPDVNGDGVVNILDLIFVAQHMGESTGSAAPSILAMDSRDGLDSAMVQAWIEQALLEDDGSITFQKGIANLQRLLASLIPEETTLLPNYPNPFNPETWIPYHLANPSEVQITIYNTHGSIVRRLNLGYQREGYYTDRSRAAYWDGKNAVGERVASGVYFYQLQADHLSFLRKMLILK